MLHARQVIGQIFGVLCTVSSCLFFYTALKSGNSLLGLLGCLDGAGAYLFFRRSRSLAEKSMAEALAASQNKP